MNKQGLSAAVSRTGFYTADAIQGFKADINLLCDIPDVNYDIGFVVYQAVTESHNGVWEILDPFIRVRIGRLVE